MLTSLKVWWYTRILNASERRVQENLETIATFEEEVQLLTRFTEDLRARNRREGFHQEELRKKIASYKTPR